MCGVKGMDDNEFKDKSRYSGFPHIIFSKGTDDEPAGDCIKCEQVWELGGYAEEFGSKEQFKQEREKDIGLQQAFHKACLYFVDCQNKGRRCRARNEKTKKRKGGNFLEQIQEDRKNRKRILKHRGRQFKVRVPMKIFTVERYEEVHKKTVEQAGLKPEWHKTPEGPKWGVHARALPEGEFDADDELFDGVMEEEEVDDGSDELRHNQQQIKYDALESQIAERTKSAAKFAVAAALKIIDADDPKVDAEKEDEEAGSSSSDTTESEESDDGGRRFSFQAVPPPTQNEQRAAGDVAARSNQGNSRKSKHQSGRASSTTAEPNKVRQPKPATATPAPHRSPS